MSIYSGSYNIADFSCSNHSGKDKFIINKIIMRNSNMKFQCCDDSSNNSPLTVSSTEIAIKVPPNADTFGYWAENHAMRLSEVTGMAKYDKIQSNSGDKFGCSGMDYIYVKRDGSNDVTLHFRFNTI